MAKVLYDDERLGFLYERVVGVPNKDFARRGFIRCPECGEEILLIPTLRVMNEAIENHVNLHKEQLKDAPIRGRQVAIFARLALTIQTLKQIYRLQES